MTARKPCRCLAAEMPEGEALSALIRERISGIPDEEKTGSAEYARRLEQCRSCGNLNRGTCALCGCYVEIRAVRKRMGCPEIPPRW